MVVMVVVVSNCCRCDGCYPLLILYNYNYYDNSQFLRPTTRSVTVPGRQFFVVLDRGSACDSSCVAFIFIQLRTQVGVFGRGRLTSPHSSGDSVAGRLVYWVIQCCSKMVVPNSNKRLLLLLFHGSTNNSTSSTSFLSGCCCCVSNFFRFVLLLLADGLLLLLLLLPLI